MYVSEGYFWLWCGWEGKRTKDYLGIKRDILKVKGTDFNVWTHGKIEGQEGNINDPVFSSSSAFKCLCHAQRKKQNL